MTYISLYAAIIAAVTSVVSATLVQLFVRSREVRQERAAEADRVRHEQQALEKSREERVQVKSAQCVTLLGMVRGLQVLSVTTRLDSIEKAERVREVGAEIASQGDVVEFEVPEVAVATVELTLAAKELAAEVEQHGSPETEARAGFDRLIDQFKEAALDSLRETGD